MRIAYLVFYDGTKHNGFCGIGNTIENNIKEAFKRIIKREVKVLKASRTDPGVSAIGNVVAVDLDEEIIPEVVNSYLPKSIRFWGWCIVNENFNPRRAIEREYIYFKLYEGEDIEVMYEVAKLFIGTHNLRNFMIRKNNEKSIVTIYDISINRLGDVLIMKFRGKGFRNKMLRKIAWTLHMVGLGKLSIDYVKKLISCEIDRVVPSLEPQGLVLVKVRYEKELNFKYSIRAIREIVNYLKSNLRQIYNTYQTYTYMLKNFLNLF